MRHDSEKWLKYFLDNDQMSLMRALREADIVAPLSAHASVDVGVVTGLNAFFVLDEAQVHQHDLSAPAQVLSAQYVHLSHSRFGGNRRA